MSATQDIALVDDHHLMREALAGLINKLPGYRVSMQCEHGKDFIERLALTGAQPTIAIIDLHMPVMDGFDTIYWIKKERPDIKPLALTFDSSEDAMVRAIRNGARGFLRKNAESEQFKQALNAIRSSDYYHSEEIQAHMMENPALMTRKEKKREEILSMITKREMQFLHHVCDASEPTYLEISRNMKVHHRTVDNYRIGLFDKFHIRSKTGLVLFCMRWNLVDIK